jgi:hypothetical protein
MSKQKIAVIGKGTAGSQAVIHFARFFPDVEIDWYFDPQKPAQSVGEGSTLQLPRNLFNSMGFSHESLIRVNGSFKTGIYKKNWGQNKKEFFHDFPPPQVGYHFSATELQNYIEKRIGDISKKVRIVPKEVDYNNVDANFVFNASGRPENFQDFNLSNYIPVNAAYVTQCYWERARFQHTLTIAAKHGWIFGIPLQNRLSIGYMYNQNISNIEDLKEELDQIFKEYQVEPSQKTNSLTFKNYYRKNNYENDGRLIHSGNASFFLEPLEATSIGVMDQVQRAAFDIWTGKKSPEQANLEYLNLLHQIEFMIMMHYAAGSSLKTEFWEFAQQRGVKKLKDSSEDQQIKNIYNQIKDLRGYNMATSLDLPEYGLWWSGSFVQNIEGLGVKKIMDEIFS